MFYYFKPLSKIANSYIGNYPYRVFTTEKIKVIIENNIIVKDKKELQICNSILLDTITTLAKKQTDSIIQTGESLSEYNLVRKELLKAYNELKIKRTSNYKLTVDCVRCIEWKSWWKPDYKDTKSIVKEVVLGE